MKKTATLYLLTLSVVDTMLLDIDLLTRWLKVAVDFDIRVQSDVSCKLYTCSIYVLHQLASWLIVLATVERTMVLFYPWYAKDVLTKRYEAVVMGIITLVVIIFNAHFMLTQEVFPVYHKTTGESAMTCGTYWSPHRWFVQRVWPWIDLTLFAIVPCTVIILCNGYIAAQLVCVRASRRSVTPEVGLEDEPGPPQTERTRRGANIEERNVDVRGWVGGGVVAGGWKPTVRRLKMVSVCKMVIITNTCFLVTCLPLCIILVGENIWLSGASQSQVEQLHIGWVSAHLLVNVFQACKFLLYWLISQRIRQIVRKIFRNQSVEVEDLQSVTLDTGL
jgi:hypothetical protein